VPGTRRELVVQEYLHAGIFSPRSSRKFSS
jgi:hypothetical protein